MRCPNWLGHDCPYPEPQCGKACVDSWNGDDCYAREGERWAWTGDQHD